MSISGATKTITKRVPMAYVSQMVVKALQALKHPEGCSLSRIVKYVQKTHNDQLIKSQMAQKVPLAIERGVKFGAIKCNNDSYKLDSVMILATRQVRHNLCVNCGAAARQSMAIARKKPIARRKKIRVGLKLQDRISDCN